MTASKPSLALLRDLSDENVLLTLMDHSRLTRAELAVYTGLAKPTVAAAIRRLEELGLVFDTGERTTGRGGVGTYYALSAEVGVALAISIAPEGIAVEVVNTVGECQSRFVEPVTRPAAPAAVVRMLVKAVKAATAGIDGKHLRTAVVSAADPVDRNSGSLVHLPDAPFLLGALSPVKKLQPLIAGPIVVDNDVNWAARSEQATRAAAGGQLDDFVYLHLGEGLGCAVVTDGEVRRGHSGLAGEVAHLITTGSDGHAVTFTSIFEQLSLQQTESTAIDVHRLLARLDSTGGAELARTLARAICGVLSAAIAFCDPSAVVIGGTWGTAAPLLAELRRQAAILPRAIPVEVATAIGSPSLAGARTAAVDALRRDVLARATSAAL
ncbi:ROK family transcriptional regulator [Jatrophihabitans sp. GAS493]|uniref:ROK family transcriptional regulator n=1 Tax=Jatrophihabitans sp. GAS493 TaxID=1907575 RepID=UPI000BB95506|nr:ROK family transcriptional regulator [Jatrophihabitans sp. GAS493]